MRATKDLRLYLIVLVATFGLLAASCGVDDAGDATSTSEVVELSVLSAQDDGQSDDLLLGTAGSWTPEDIEDLSIDESNSIPVIDQTLAQNRVFEDYWAWDWWPVRTRSGEVAEIDGYQIAIALTAPADILPGKRHDIATHRYGLSSDGGQTWELGGEVFGSEDPLGSRQWAGSAMYDEDQNKLYAFYTIAGETGDPVEEAAASQEPDEESEPGPSGGPIRPGISYRQQMGLATADVVTGDDGVGFENWTDHEVLFSGNDTDLYAATEGTAGGAGSIDAFRDPWLYQDPDTGEEYVLFTATMPRAECDGDGVVGIARATSDDLRSFEILPPLLDGHCVNNELERPHIIDRNGETYLLFTTHAHTFRDGTSGPEGYYGFVAPDLFGPYEPLNGTGLVLANPDNQPYQAYSWMGLPNGLVTSFFQYFDLPDGVELSYVGSQQPEFQLEHFGGTFAPTLALEFDGATTNLVEELDPGVLVRTAAQTESGEDDTTDGTTDDSEATTPDATDDQTDATGGTDDQSTDDQSTDNQSTDDQSTDDQSDADATTPQGGVDAGFGGAASLLDDEGS